MAGCKYPNIDASGFKPGCYVGYANGVWTIKRNNKYSWIATRADGTATRTGPTLRSISDQLAVINFQASIKA